MLCEDFEKEERIDCCSPLVSLLSYLCETYPPGNAEACTGSPFILGLFLEVPPRYEFRSLVSESRMLTIAPRELVPPYLFLYLLSVCLPLCLSTMCVPGTYRGHKGVFP